MASPDTVLRIPMKDYLRNSSLPTDVTFIFHVFQDKRTKKSKHMHDVVFPAHRDCLLTASPYFKSLLSDDWKPVNGVPIEDCQPGAFRILLRWIYGDQAVAEGIPPSTFIAVLLAADRFGMKDLSLGRPLIGQLLTLDLFRGILDVLEHQQIECANELSTECAVNVNKLLAVDHFFEIFDMVEHRRIECADELTEKCLHYLDKNAAALTKHASFLHISDERLKEILTRNSLGIHEIHLYLSATKWARAQLKRAKKRPTHQAIREVLGDALFLIRFPTMHPQEFKNGPAKDNILSAEEKLAIYGRIHGAGPTSCAFSAETRRGPSPLPLRDFTPTYCQKCGARLNGDICPECGCMYRSTVECVGCSRRFFVNDKAFAVTYCQEDFYEDCHEVAYRCSCAALTATEEYGRIHCKRCGLKAWHCGNSGRITERACKCWECKEEYREDYSDGELTPSEDDRDDDGDDDEEEEDGEDEH